MFQIMDFAFYRKGKKMQPMNQVTVIGAGTMGSGIAYLCALHGYKTFLYDVVTAQLEHAQNIIRKLIAGAEEKGKITSQQKSLIIENLSYIQNMEHSIKQSDIIIEAVVEDMQVKKKLFQELELGASPHTIFASNTSSLSLTELAATCTYPERVIGLHFFNPPHLMKLLEIVEAQQTSKETLNAALSYARSIEKDPIVVHDSPGFASSRLGIALGLEAIRMLEEKVASAADIDKAMELGYRHPMGPLKLTDLVGLDVRLSIAEYLFKELGERYRPPRLLKKMVLAGKLGKKSGEGFYRWDGDKTI